MTKIELGLHVLKMVWKKFKTGYQIITLGSLLADLLRLNYFSLKGKGQLGKGKLSFFSNQRELGQS